MGPYHIVQTGMVRAILALGKRHLAGGIDTLEDRGRSRL